MKRRANNTAKRERLPGFTLVETIVAVALLSTVLLFCMALVPSFKLSNRRAGMELEASAQAQSRLEELRAEAFDDIVASSDTVKVNGVDYQRIIEVTPSASGLSKNVRVIMRWSWQEKQSEIFRETIVCRIPRG